MSSLPDEGPIVIINVYNDRCDALALMAGLSEPKHVPLPKFSYQEAERLAKGLRSYLIQRRVRLGVPLNDHSPLSEVDFPEVLRLLWSDVVSPILEALAFSVWLLSFLPARFSLIILSRYLNPLKSCLVYGGAQLALLPFFLSTQQASTFRAKAVLDNAYLNLLSHLTFQQ